MSSVSQKIIIAPSTIGQSCTWKGYQMSFHAELPGIYVLFLSVFEASWYFSPRTDNFRDSFVLDGIIRTQNLCHKLALI